MITQAQQVTHYDWLTSGEKSGSMTVTQINEQHTITTFEFNDRGRGPKIRDEIWTNDDATIKKRGPRHPSSRLRREDEGKVRSSRSRMSSIDPRQLDIGRLQDAERLPVRETTGALATRTRSCERLNPVSAARPETASDD